MGVLHKSERPEGDFVSDPATAEALASKKPFSFTGQETCGLCKTRFPITHNTGVPMGKLRLPYEVLVSYTCLNCGVPGMADFKLEAVPDP